MTDVLGLMAATAAGAGLGVLYFTGLWWTIVKGMAAERPTPWFLGSMCVRVSLMGAGFYVVSQSDWRRWLMCLLGFLMARTWVTRKVRHAP